MSQSADSVKTEFSHYYRACPYEGIDIYRILKLFDVTDPCLQHAIKKLMVAGSRGSKDIRQDVSEVISSLVRWQAMRAEEDAVVRREVSAPAEAPQLPILQVPVLQPRLRSFDEVAPCKADDSR